MTHGLGSGDEWRQALDDAVIGLSPGADLALVFASDDYRSKLNDLLHDVQLRLQPGAIAGCTGQAIIGQGREVEDEPSISIMPLSLPGARISTHHLRHETVGGLDTEAFRALLGLDDGDVNAWLIFADPFTFDVESLVTMLGASYPETRIMGGLASARTEPRSTQVFNGTTAIGDGCVLVAIGGDWTIETIVSQGAEPLGKPWTITGAEKNMVETIGGKPALDVLVETVQALPPEEQQRAGQNLLVGLAMDEYREHFARGDFLIRNLVGADRERGALALNTEARVGQTIQFHLRDSAAADEELRLMLETAKLTLGGIEPAGALICSCNGRGAGLFGEPNHDAGAVAERFGPLPAAGFFCNGEIGPVGDRTFLHGFTASIGLFVPETLASPGSAESPA